MNSTVFRVISCHFPSNLFLEISSKDSQSAIMTVNILFHIEHLCYVMPTCRHFITKYLYFKSAKSSLCFLKLNSNRFRLRSNMMWQFTKRQRKVLEVKHVPVVQYFFKKFYVKKKRGGGDRQVGICKRSWELVVLQPRK